MSLEQQAVASEPTAGAVDDLMVGNLLLSNTTVCEASRLLLPVDAGYDLAKLKGAFRACDLLALIDAMVLHDQIFYLPASLPDDIADLTFRNGLMQGGVLTPLPRKANHDAIGRALLAALSTVQGLRGHLGEGAPVSFDKFRSQLLQELPGTADNEHGVHAGLNDVEYPFALVPSGSSARSFDEAARELIGALDYGASGAYEVAAASLRVMYYVFAAEHYRLPYLSSANSWGMPRKFPNYFHPSVRQRLYEQLAAALRTTVDAVAQEYEGAIVFVPPFSALVLDRARTASEIPNEALSLREEYADFRRKLHDLERARLKTRSLNDRIKASRQIEKLGNGLARQFDKPAQLRLEAALRYIPDVTGIVTNPTNPAGWAQMLLDLPVKALIGWFQLRPVAKLVKTANEVGQMADYDRLLTKHFGEAVAQRTMEVQHEMTKRTGSA